ncbi:MAG: helix-turn-helix domain-containing protein [Silicimonas sp.]
MDYVQAVRIEEAKQMLETTDLGADAIAFEVGYDDPSAREAVPRETDGGTDAIQPKCYPQAPQDVRNRSLR